MDHIALEIVKIGGRDEDQVPGSETPRSIQNRPDTGVGVMDMVKEGYLKLVVSIVMKVSLSNCRM